MNINTSTKYAILLRYHTGHMWCNAHENGKYIIHCCSYGIGHNETIIFRTVKEVKHFLSAYNHMNYTAKEVKQFLSEACNQ